MLQTETRDIQAAALLQDSAELRRALASVDLSDLLMTYTHLTHDLDLLERMAPHIRPLFSPEPTAIPDALAEELRSKAHHALTTPGGVSGGQPSRDLMRRIMTVGMGETVDDEFVDLLFEQCGFDIPVPRKSRVDRSAPPAGFKVLLIGAGLTGLAAGIKLQEAGYDYVCIEKNADVAGTWLENVYPGVAVDTPSHFYSYSFHQKADWDHYFPRGEQVRQYLNGVADHYGLRSHIRFETSVIGMIFDEAAAVWKVTVKDKAGNEEVILANAVLNAHGRLNRWSLPNIPGIESFAGPVMHSAGWDRSVDLKGKRVAVIGTGASGAQIVPNIAPEAEQVTVFMRSRYWVMPNPKISGTVPDATKWALAHIPGFQQWFRFGIYWNASDGYYQHVLRDPEWPEGIPSVSAVNEQLRQYGLAYMQQKLGHRPDLLEKLTPDFPIFSKRMVLDAGWFDALQRDNVEVENDPIAEILPHAIRTKSGKLHEVDVIACATGFNIGKMLGEVQVIGRDGRCLNEEWGDDDPRAYLGTTVPGYPNFFMVGGPNTGPNHGAGANLVAEAVINYIIECLDLMAERKVATIEPTEQAYADWNAKIDDQLTRMIWSHPKANSYYNNSAGRVFLSNPFRLVDLWNWTREPVEEHFVLS